MKPTYAEYPEDMRGMYLKMHSNQKFYAFDFQVGDRVRFNEPLFKDSYGKFAVVTHYVPYNPDAPISEHGFIELDLDGEVVHFVAYTSSESLIKVD